MYSLEQLNSMLQQATAANDTGAMMMIQQEIDNQMAQRTQQAQLQQRQYSNDQLQQMLQRAQDAGDTQAVSMINNQITDNTMAQAQRTQALRDSGNPVGAFFADMGATLNKAIPNMKRLLASSDSPEYQAATRDIEQIEKFQDQLRQAFPSAVFGGEVGAPAAAMAATVPLSAPGAALAGMTEAAAMTPADQDPRTSALVAGFLPPALGVALRGTEKVLGLAGQGMEGIVSTLYRSPDDEAARGLRRYLSDAGVNPEDVLKEYAALGPNATLADVQALRGASQYSAITPAGRQFDDVFKQRQLNQRERILREAEDILGADASMMRSTLRRFIHDRAENSTPLYQEAFRSGYRTSYDQGLWDDLIDRTRGMGSFAKGRRLAKTDGYEFDAENLGLQELHYIKLGIDSDIETAIRAGDDTAVNALMRLKMDFGSQMENASPAYAAAAKQFSGDSAVINAIELGKRLFNPKDKGRLIETPDMAELVANFGADEMAAFQQGAVSAINERIGKVAGTADSARQLWNKPNIQEAIRVVFPNERDFTRYMDFLNKESAFTDTWNDLYRGSQTAPRQAAEQAFRTGAADVAQGPFEIARQFFAGKLSPEGQQRLAVMMFDKNKTPEQLRQTMVESGIIPDSVPLQMVRQMQENWPRIYRDLTSIDPSVQFAGSGALAPGLVGGGNDYLGGNQ